MAAFFALKYAYTRPALRVSAPADNMHRIPFYILFSLLMLTILHGASILKVLCILSLNYAIAKATGGTRLAIPATWLFNGGVLLANEWYGGYTFATLHPELAFMVRPASTISFVLPDDSSRMACEGYTRVGTLALTSPCYALSRSASTTTGHVIESASRMYVSSCLLVFGEMECSRIVTAAR
jgi:hypothetical protein